MYSMTSVTALGRKSDGDTFVITRYRDPESQFIPCEDSDWCEREFCGVVDLGNSNSAGYLLMAPHVVVLSHDDEDHIRQAAKCLHHWGSVCSHHELWVPAEWAIVGMALGQIDNPNSDRLSKIVAEVIEKIGGVEPGSDSVNETALTEAWRDLQEAYTRRKLSEDEYLDDPDVAEHRYGEVDSKEPFNDDYKQYGPAGKTVERVVATCVHTARILRAAYMMGWRIRYFDFEVAPSHVNYWMMNPNPEYPLAIVNAHEVLIQVRHKFLNPADTIFFAAYLTIQNSRSLVTYLQPSAPHQRDDAILWADSGGDFSVGMPPTVCLSTAPHHCSTSQDHDPAWIHIDRMKPMILLTTRNHTITQALQRFALGPWLSLDTRNPGPKNRCQRIPQDVSVHIETASYGRTRPSFHIRLDHA